jgi:hypothetical protein
MCYTALIKDSHATAQTKNAIRKALCDKLKWNEQGFFVGSLDTPHAIRTMDMSLATKVTCGMPLDNLFVHYRLATTGQKTTANVHGWVINGWTCSHNGFVHGLSGTITDTDSDSKRFFDLLCNGITDLNPKKIKRAIRKACFDHDFSGRAIIYHRATDTAVMFGNFHVYEVGGAVIFSSSYLSDLTDTQVKEVNGLAFGYENNVGKTTIDGIYIMDNAKTTQWNLRKIGELRERIYNYKSVTPSPKPQCLLPEIIVPELPRRDYWKTAVENNIFQSFDSDVVGFDLGGNEIVADDTGLHLANGGCCATGSCHTLWRYVDKTLIPELLKCGVPYTDLAF